MLHTQIDVQRLATVNIPCDQIWPGLTKTLSFHVFYYKYLLSSSNQVPEPSITIA